MRLNNKMFARFFAVTAGAFLLLNAAAAQAPDYQYRLNIKGMVCAFCAHNVGQRVASLAAVVDETVHVDLQAQQLQFDSRDLVTKASLIALLEDSGFRLIDVSYRAIDSVTMPPLGTPVAQVSFPANQLETPLSEALLATLGDNASRQGHSLRVEAPESSRQRLIKELLAGRKKSVPLAFIVNDTSNIMITELSNAE